eukprot:CAMPEP_0179439988 /NCGR_PEP_ID=MMETSP0799-20121207/23596_1 /TAXON_ID=46947 /ORGANISM="Geminigera cryophila, Strain CCMP2564" /LENGTH=80 /DNA_ID=CAMNT_0021222905 /DNA_START=12 /DNA_END=254 /DNA_ORIENTATION=+
MFETLVQSESVLQGLREAASLAAQARKSKNGDKMAQVLKMLQGLQGHMVTSPQHKNVAAKAAVGAGGNLASILAGTSPLP